MADMDLAKHLVYIKDGEGNTLRMAESVFNNDILQHAPSFPCMDTVFAELKEFKLRPDDIWLLDFPKSGTHWLQGILELLLSRDVKALSERNAQTLIEMCQSLNDFEALPSPRVINTHMKLGLMPRRFFENNKVIIMIRNPKSVAVSYYHHFIKLPFYEYSGSFEGYLPLFSSKDRWCGTWFEYVQAFWDAFKDKPNVHFVFFEELKKEPAKVIQGVSQFLGLDHDEDFIDNVAKETSIECMKKKQREAAGDNNPAVEVFYRKGEIDDLKNHFTVAQNEMFDAVYDEKMKSCLDLKEKIQFT